MSTAELIQRYNDAIQAQSDIIDEMFRLLTSVLPSEELDKTGLLRRISRVASILYGIEQEEEN